MAGLASRPRLYVRVMRVGIRVGEVRRKRRGKIGEEMRERSAAVWEPQARRSTAVGPTAAGERLNGRAPGRGGAVTMKGMVQALWPWVG